MIRRAAVMIADDHPLVSQGLKAVLKPQYNVVAVESDAREVVNSALRHRPDVIILDLSMPHRNGLELLPELIAAVPQAKVIVVTMHIDRTLADLAMQSGAHGFLPKESSAEELNNAIAEVLEGKRFISPRVPKRSFRDGAAVEHPELDRLTPRHLEILRLIGDGKSSGEIAEELGLSPRTVEFHRSSIRKALGVTTEIGLVRFAVVLRVGSNRSQESEDTSEA
ncbi:MAG: Transcriptional regulatory protein DegU [Gemmatimonadaceae bacterium]|nr:Transcriptional regulatory protein DegU [Gemmatimonadaceae bacterium]